MTQTSFFQTKKFYLSFSAVAFAIFVFFSYLVHKNYFLHIDFNTTVRLQDHISRRFDGIFSNLSTFGRFEIMTVLLIIILAVRKKITAFVALIFFASFHLFEIYGKTFVTQQPPPHFLLRTQELVNFPKYYVSPDFSYPSGHSARALFITTILFFIAYKTTKLNQTQKLFIYGALVIYDISMLTSRIYLGEHWLSDVIGGSLLGLSFGLLSMIFI